MAAQRPLQQQAPLQQRRRRQVRPAAGRGGGPNRDSDSDRWARRGSSPAAAVAGQQHVPRWLAAVRCAHPFCLPAHAVPPRPLHPVGRSEDFFMQDNSMDQPYYEEEELTFEGDDEGMRLYLDSADVQVGRGRRGSSHAALQGHLQAPCARACRASAPSNHASALVLLMLPPPPPLHLCRSGASGPRRGSSTVSAARLAGGEGPLPCYHQQLTDACLSGLPACHRRLHHQPNHPQARQCALQHRQHAAPGARGAHGGARWPVSRGISASRPVQLCAAAPPLPALVLAAGWQAALAHRCSDPSLRQPRCAPACSPCRPSSWRSRSCSCRPGAPPQPKCTHAVSGPSAWAAAWRCPCGLALHPCAPALHRWQLCHRLLWACLQRAVPALVLRCRHGLDGCRHPHCRACRGLLVHLGSVAAAAHLGAEEMPCNIALC